MSLAVLILTCLVHACHSNLGISPFVGQFLRTETCKA